MPQSPGPPDPAEAFADLARRLAGRIPPGFPGPAILLPLVEWQRTLLAAYTRALEDPRLADALEENARMLARTLLTWYLEILRSQRELRDTMVREQKDLVTAWGDALERLRVQLLEASRTSDEAEGPGERPPAGETRPGRGEGQP